MMKSGKTWRGDIVIDINMEYLLKNANLDPSILNGYVLYTNKGDLIFSQGEFPAWQDVNHSSETYTVVLLQPLVENAIFYGLCSRPGKGNQNHVISSFSETQFLTHSPKERKQKK